MKRFTVDRLERETVVLIDQTGEEQNVPASALPTDCKSEGAVLMVPQGSDGRLDWKKATRDRAEEQRLRVEGDERLKRLRRRDPGGDVTL